MKKILLLLLLNGGALFFVGCTKNEGSKEDATTKTQEEIDQFTASLVDASYLTPFFFEDDFKRTIWESRTVDILFEKGSSEVRAAETTKRDYNEICTYIREMANTADGNIHLQDIQLKGYVDPLEYDGDKPGSEDFGYQLSLARGESVMAAVAETMKDVTGLSYIVAAFCEDWDGFKKLVYISDMQDKDLVLRILSIYTSSAERNAEIRNLPQIFAELETNICPLLRRTQIEVTVEITGKSDQELLDLAQTSPGTLNLEELLYAATLTSVLTEKAGIYDFAKDKYDYDARAYNNKWAVAFMMGLEDSSLDRAILLSVHPGLQYNYALLELGNEDPAKALSYLNFGKIAIVDGSVNAAHWHEAAVLASILDGDYAEAAEYASKGPVSSDLAIMAYLLAGEYNSAKGVFSGMTAPGAVSYYLNAVIGARTKDKAAMLSALGTAISLDVSLAERAADDHEFKRYYNDADFKALLN